MILYNRQKRATKCYYEGKDYAKGQENQASKDGYYGWCGVCLKNAPIWGYGYCPYGFELPTETKSITRAKRAKVRIISYLFTNFFSCIFCFRIGDFVHLCVIFKVKLTNLWKRN